MRLHKNCRGEPRVGARPRCVVLRETDLAACLCVHPRCGFWGCRHSRQTCPAVAQVVLERGGRGCGHRRRRAIRIRAGTAGAVAIGNTGASTAAATGSCAVNSSSCSVNPASLSVHNPEHATELEEPAPAARRAARRCSHSQSNCNCWGWARVRSDGFIVVLFLTSQLTRSRRAVHVSRLGR